MVFANFFRRRKKKDNSLKMLAVNFTSSTIDKTASQAVHEKLSAQRKSCADNGVVMLKRV